MDAVKRFTVSSVTKANVQKLELYQVMKYTVIVYSTSNAQVL